MSRRLAPDSEAASAVVGAILVLAILGLAIVYVNASYVPRQGERLEAQAADEAEAALRGLASDLSGAPAPLRRDLALRPERATPPLLAGIILSPVRAEGGFSFDPTRTNVTVSLDTDAPAGGVPAGDPTREALPDGRMRVYLLGNATRGAPVGALGITTGGGYLAPAEMRVEAGAVVARRDSGSTLASPPALHVTAAASGGQPVTRVAWRIPVLAGAQAELGGAASVDASLLPGPASSAGGSAGAWRATITVETDSLAAWRAALEQAVGAHGTVAATATGPDRGIVSATVLPPSGTPTGTKAVEVSLSLVRYEATFSARGG